MSGLLDLSGNNLRISCSDTIQNILCTPTSTIFFNTIDLSGGITTGALPNTFNYTSDMIGYTIRSTGTNSATNTITTTIYNISTVTNLSSGIYIIYLFTNLITSTTTTNITEVSLGLTTTSGSFEGGTGKIIVMSNTTSKQNATTSGRVCAKTMTTLNVPVTTTYYFVAQFNTTQLSLDTRVCYCICTRIA